MAYVFLKESGYIATSDSNYTIGMDVYTETTTHAYYIRPWIKRNGAYKRYRHVWRVVCNVDGSNVVDYNTTLPDDNAQAGVVSAGYLNMQANVGYRWGSDIFIGYFANDGSQHTFGLVLQCVDTVPRDCPRVINNTTQWCSVTITTTQDPIYPGKPSNPRLSFNEDTRVLTLSWTNGGATDHYLVYRNWDRANGTRYGEGYYGNGIWLYDTNIPISETIPEEVARVEYQIDARSITGHQALSNEVSANTPANTKVKVKVGTEWKKAIAWVKVGTEWKKCKKVYVKDNGAWHQTIY